MPKIIPTGGVVSWPEHEGVLGVVGVAPWATLDFIRSFYSLFDVNKDWHYPRVLLDINTKLPSRGRHLQLGERDPSPYIAETISELAQAGATVVVVACNTAHILFDKWGVNSPVPVLNIIDSVVAEVINKKSFNVVALTSESLAKNDLYGISLEAADFNCYRLPDHYQTIVSGLIEQVKIAGQLSAHDEDKLNTLIAHLQTKSVDTVLLGCTELTVLKARLVKEGYVAIDSNEALARAAYAAVSLSPSSVS